MHKERGLEMDMKCYKFKDNRRIFKLISLVFIIAIVSMSLTAIREKMTTMFALQSNLIYLVIIFITYRLTRQNIYIGDTSMKASKTIPYIMVTEIYASDKIYIKYRGGWLANIKLIDIDNNYDRYKELLDVILSKVDETIAKKAGSAEELLESVKEKRKEVNNSGYSSKTGKPNLGGWLKVIIVISYFGTIGGLFGALAFVAPDVEITAFTYQLILLSLVSVAIVILMHRRTKNVKYALGARELVNLAFSLLLSINRIIEEPSFLPIGLNIVGMLLIIISSVIWIQIYFEYINNFERSKNTLIN